MIPEEPKLQATEKGRMAWLWHRGKAHSRAHSRLTGEGLYYLVIVTLVFAGALIREVNLLLILAGMLLGPLLFSWWLSAIALRRLHIRRTIPRGICAGDLLVVHLELSKVTERRGRWMVVVEDEVRHEKADPLSTLSPEVLFTHLQSQQSRTQAYRGRLIERGCYQFGPLKLSTRYPFGLIRRTLKVDQIDPLFVYPRLGLLTRRWYARHRDSFEGSSRQNRRHSRSQGDLYGVREWRHGDNRRWIHWRSSARHDWLVVCQFEQYRNRDIALLVDLWQPDEPNVADLENVELAVSFAASVASDVCRQGGANLWLGGVGDPNRLYGGPASMALLQDIMERLANVQAENRPIPDELLEQTLARIDRGTEVVLVGPRALDLNDSRQFPSLFQNARNRVAGRIRQIDTSSDTLADFFLMEPLSG